MRYGYKTPPSSFPIEFQFAFLLTPQKGFSYSAFLPIRKTIDNRSLRVIVTFEEETSALIITAIDLDMEE
jgi:hypothetical protein